MRDPGYSPNNGSGLSKYDEDLPDCPRCLARDEIGVMNWDVDAFVCAQCFFECENPDLVSPADFGDPHDHRPEMER